jgi:putative transposase
MKRSKYSEEQVVRILSEVQSGKTVREVCKAHGLSEFTFYTWRKKYAGLQSQDVGKMRDLERENSELKRLLAEQMLENGAMKKLIQKNGWRS